jgi:hypothetical protein
MRSGKVFLAAATAALVIAFFALPADADQGGAQNAINQAQATIKSCFNAFNAAEKAGANVEGLAVTLNGAAQNLSYAKVAFDGGDYDAAYNYASKAQSMLSGFEAQAQSIEQTAVAKTAQTRTVNVVLLGVSAFLACSGVAGWLILDRKQRYM